jgi:hypothetical protein
VRSDCVRAWFNINQHRSCAGPFDGRDCCDRSVGYGENQIPGADAAGAQCQLDRIRPIADTDAVGDPDESGESDIKARDFSAQDVGAPFENPSDGGIDCGALRKVAGTWIGL